MSVFALIIQMEAFQRRLLQNNGSAKKQCILFLLYYGPQSWIKFQDFFYPTIYEIVLFFLIKCTFIQEGKIILSAASVSNCRKSD